METACGGASPACSELWTSPLATPGFQTTKMAAGTVRCGNGDVWLVQERRGDASTGGTITFFGGATEAQDRTMRDTMQRVSSEKLVLISRHGRPSRQPIYYGAQIATVIVSTLEIHLFVARIEEGTDIHPKETEQDETVGAHWLPLSTILNMADAKMMSSTRLLAACVANIPRNMLNDVLRPPSSLLKQFNPQEWKNQPKMRQSRITARSDRRTVSAYLHGYTTIAALEGPALTTFAAAEDQLVAWLHRCAAGRMKMCDVWELLSFSAHQIITQHVENRAARLGEVRDAPFHRMQDSAIMEDEEETVTITNTTQDISAPVSSDQGGIWYVSDFMAEDNGMRVQLRQNNWMQNEPGNECCIFVTAQGQTRAGQPLETIYVGDAVKVVSFTRGLCPPLMAIVATP